MSIVEAFAGKRASGKRDPDMPPMPRVVETRPANSDLAETIERVNNMVGTIDFLREENRQLRQDGALALMRVKDLEREAGARGLEMEAYRRYAVRIQTHLEHITDACSRANEDAIEAGANPQPMPDEALKAVVDAVGKELNGVEALVEEKPKEPAAT